MRRLHTFRAVVTAGFLTLLPMAVFFSPDSYAQSAAVSQTISPLQCTLDVLRQNDTLTVQVNSEACEQSVEESITGTNPAVTIIDQDTQRTSVQLPFVNERGQTIALDDSSSQAQVPFQPLTSSLSAMNQETPPQPVPGTLIVMSVSAFVLIGIIVLI